MDPLIVGIQLLAAIHFCFLVLTVIMSAIGDPGKADQNGKSSSALLTELINVDTSDVYQRYLKRFRASNLTLVYCDIPRLVRRIELSKNNSSVQFDQTKEPKLLVLELLTVLVQIVEPSSVVAALLPKLNQFYQQYDSTYSKFEDDLFLETLISHIGTKCRTVHLLKLLNQQNIHSIIETIKATVMYKTSFFSKDISSKEGWKIFFNAQNKSRSGQVELEILHQRSEQTIPTCFTFTWQLKFVLRLNDKEDFSEDFSFVQVEYGIVSWAKQKSVDAEIARKMDDLCAPLRICRP